jgi:hypothetical protein
MAKKRKRVSSPKRKNTRFLEARASKLRRVTLQTRVKPGLEYRRVVAIALEFPGVEEENSYGTPALKVKKKFLARLRTEAEGALAIRCDFLDRQILLQADPRAFFITDHYLNYPMILVHLKRIRVRELRDLITRAWRMVAPPKLVTDDDAKQS